MSRAARAETARAVPFVPEAAATAIVRSRRDLMHVTDRLQLAIEILRHLDMTEPVARLEEIVAHLEEVGGELSRVRA